MCYFDCKPIVSWYTNYEWVTETGLECTEHKVGSAMSGAESLPQLIELNVGGVHYSTSLSTLRSDSGSKLAQMFANPEDTVLKDSKVSCWDIFSWYWLSDWDWICRANISLTVMVFCSGTFWITCGIRNWFCPKTFRKRKDWLWKQTITNYQGKTITNYQGKLESREYWP